jgi:hypothetical protein
VPDVMDRAGLKVSKIAEVSDAAGKAKEVGYLRTKASLSLTLRTNASVRRSRDSSGRLAPPAEESTRRLVVFAVKLYSKIAYMPA